MLTLSFTHLHKQAHSIHNFLPGLLGSLILFATQAFVPQRQFLHRGLLSRTSPIGIIKLYLYSNSSKFTSYIKL